jgi:hypothetical protein
MTPKVIASLITIMTVSEAINSRKWIEKSGVLDIPEIRKTYEDKISKASSDRRVASTTIGERKSAKGDDVGINAILKKAEQDKIDAGLRITCSTDLYTDISGSMQKAIEISKRIAPHIASLIDADFRAYCFNETSRRLISGKRSIEEFRTAFNLIRADGATCIGCSLEQAIQDGGAPEQAIVVTDQQENRMPYLTEVFKKHNLDTRFIFINVSGTQGISHNVAEELERLGSDVSEYEFTAIPDTKGWYIDVNNFTTLLTKGGYLELVKKILDLELPTRKV